MMNNLLSAIVILVLVGTFVLTPSPQPTLTTLSRAPAEAVAVAPVTDDTAAKAAIEASGYREVTGLIKAADGTWRAKAYIGTAEVQLVVDTRGRVQPD
ncbi:MAG: hypothetical protein K2X72_11115 [Reyranella sp.]|nr:hypothetical protein [Reyranella sp.]